MPLARLANRLSFMDGIQVANRFDLIDEFFLKLRKRALAKIRGMLPNLIQALDACNDVTLDAAIRRLVARFGEDRSLCRNVVSDLWRDGLIDVTCGVRSAQARVVLTNLGKHKVMTHKSGQAARALLDELDGE